MRNPQVDYYLKDASGNIVQTGKCPRSMVQLQVRSGLTAVETDRRVDDVEEKEVDGQLVRRSQAEIDSRKPPKPDNRPEKKTKNVRVEEWDALVARIEALESAARPGQ